MNTTLAIAIPLAVALIAALVKWIMAARQLSGKIETSEAADLWRESAAMREDYRNRIALAESRAERLEQRVDKCEDLNNLLGIDNRDLRKRIAQLEQELLEARSA